MTHSTSRNETICMARRTGIFAAIGALLSGCSATGAINALVSRNSYRGTEGVAYGAGPRQKLDVYRPLDTPAGGAPVIVFFYGGNWDTGERADYRFVGEALAAGGALTIIPDYRLVPEVHYPEFLNDNAAAMACSNTHAMAAGGALTIIPDYRLVPEVHYPEFLNDNAAAMAWVFEHAKDYGGDPSKIYVMGHSAGAYNASMLALDPRWLGPRRERLAGFIGLAGPYDFLPIVNPDTQRAFNWPGTPPESQPINYVNAKAPRTLLIAANTDNLVNPVRNTVGLGNKLKAAGVDTTVKRYDNVSHVTLIGAMAGPLRFLAPVRDDVLEFVGLNPK
jgi:acetyl esterase/lipase